MHIKTRNINTAFRTLVGGIFSGEIPVTTSPSRNGEVLVIEEPVLLTYEKPLERVLFNQARDANPYMHLYEAIWMLAGRNDVAPLAYYAKNMLNYSDDGKTLNGAYGYRWRHALSKVGYVYDQMEDGNGPSREIDRSVDQLKIVIEHFKANPTSRRAVVQMWNVKDDLLKIGKAVFIRNEDDGETEFKPSHIQGASKDVACNLSIMFSIRENEADRGKGPNEKTLYHRKLNMLVTNRSNDLVWGLLGTNYVHFSYLLEYLAAHIGVEVGKFHTVSNDLHIYTGGDGSEEKQTNQYNPEKWLSEYDPGYTDLHDNPGTSVKLVTDPVQFDFELLKFVELHAAPTEMPPVKGNSWKEPFFRDVASPMLRAFHAHKLLKDYEQAMAWANQIVADDWRIAATQWLERRAAKKAAKGAK